MLQTLLTLLLITPLIGFIGSLVTPRRHERTLFYVAIAAIVGELGLLGTLVYQWLGAGSTPILVSLGDVYSSSHYTLTFELYFDRLAALFLGMATLMTGLVFVFGRYYMHREPGFKRFFATLFLFFIGLSLIILAGNFEVLFMGWEIIGVSSVLLIAFYRDRFLPARNALKVFSVYRIADACLLAAIWYAHHIFEKSVNFAEFSQVIAHHGNDLAILGGLLLVAALIKSAQFPFSYWLPRAMEGPTTSSAIFYGALSVHMGLFLLLRTYPLWEDSLWLRITIAVFGLVTAVVASAIARVQSSAKTQIAYSSISQIGIMFIEVAAGLHWLALLHFISNASLRTYQLLISPSIVGYLVHDQFFNFAAPAQRIKDTALGRLRASLYILSIKEWNMNTIVSNYLWAPFKAIGRVFAFLDKMPAQVTALLILALVAVVATSATLSANAALVVSTATAVASVIFYARAFSTKGAATAAWNLIMLGHLSSAVFLAVAAENWSYFVMYGAGILVAYAVGHLVLRYLRARGESIDLHAYHGAMYVFRRLGHLFFIVALLCMTFPISPSFLAQDILLSFIPLNHAFQVVLFGVAYLLMGVATMRLYTKVFFGPHVSSHHEKAYRSS